MVSNGDGTVSEQAKQAADEATKRWNELGKQARKRADEAKKEAVKGLNSVADTLRKETREAGASPEVSENIDQLAQGLESAASYLRKHSYEDMGEDVKRVVRRSPFRTLTIIFIVGLVIGLLMRGSGQTHERHNGNFR
jgi:ElaB/YqjD/DUF883 family membrane-anchored ribosome-binding protein